MMSRLARISSAPPSDVDAARFCCTISRELRWIASPIPISRRKRDRGWKSSI